MIAKNSLSTQQEAGDMKSVKVNLAFVGIYAITAFFWRWYNHFCLEGNSVYTCHHTFTRTIQSAIAPRYNPMFHSLGASTTKVSFTTPLAVAVAANVFNIDIAGLPSRLYDSIERGMKT